MKCLKRILGDSRWLKTALLISDSFGGLYDHSRATFAVGLPNFVWTLDSRPGFPGLLSAGMTSAGVTFFRGNDGPLIVYFLNRTLPTYALYCSPILASCALPG